MEDPGAPAAPGPRGIRLGGAVLSLVEPHPGRARAFHRWYERDHFYAGCMTGPGFFAGRRFLAPRALRARRLCADADEARRGSQLAVYWLDADALDEATAWSVRTFHALREAGRIFAAADLVHAGFYRTLACAVRDADGVPPELALDHPFAGLVLAFVDAPDPARIGDWLRGASGRETSASLGAAVGVALSPAPRPAGALRAAAPGRVALLHFLDAPPDAALEEGLARHAERLAADGAGRLAFAGAFVPSVPGTDRHVDD